MTSCWREGNGQKDIDITQAVQGKGTKGSGSGQRNTKWELQNCIIKNNTCTHTLPFKSKCERTAFLFVTLAVSCFFFLSSSSCFSKDSISLSGSNLNKKK